MSSPATFRRKGKRPVQVASFWRRVVADLIDLMPLGGTVALLFFGGLIGPPAPPQHYDWIDYAALIFDQHMGLIRAPLIVLITLALIYGVAARAWRGQTLGERVIGVRVVDRAGHPIGLGRSLLRGVTTVLALCPLGLGYTWAAVDPRRQGLGDYLSGTVLLRVPKNEPTY